jgi:hypothetical protein
MSRVDVATDGAAEVRADVAAEVRAAGVHYGVAGAAAEFVDACADSLGRYAEIVFGEDGFEVVTGGVGAVDDVVAIAERAGGSTALCEVFRACAARFPGVMVGVKVCFGAVAGAPTLYVRCRCAKDDGLAFIGDVFGDGLSAGLSADLSADLGAVLAGNDIVYGLGFFDGPRSVGLKTYTLLPGGGARFVSWRALEGRLQEEHKTYQPNVTIADVSTSGEAWRRHVEFIVKHLGWHRADNVGIVERDGRRETKLYIERVGAIATDTAAV